MRLLLDTCVFLRVAQQPSLVSADSRDAIDNAANELFISDVSTWGITLKHSAGKLPLPASPRRWIPAKFAFHQLQRLTLEREAIYRSGDLPRGHPDPFDRLLAAQAIGAGMTMVSPDTSLPLLGAARLC